MKWLQDNPLGLVLAAINGVFILLVAVLAIVRASPVAVKSAEEAGQRSTGTELALFAPQVGPLNEFQVINEKPLFNESRLPVIAQVDDDPSAEDITIAVRDAPDVRLTGVIITPSVRIASLTPAKGKKGSVMAHEGESLTGKYVGWQVSSVNPRDVVLESLDGQVVELDLQVYDDKIKEPPRQKPAARAGADRAEKAAGEDEQPLSRAEQIRQRIAERREELRREQESQQTQSRQPRTRQSRRPSPDSGKQTPDSQSYQNAIRALIRNSNPDKPSGDKKDG